MAFQPDPEKFYYIVAQHSQMVLGVADANPCTYVVQQTKGDDTQYLQQFEFRADGMREFYIRLRNPDLRLLDITRESQDNGALLMIYPWHGAVANQRFQFISGGNGYYYIRAAHSGKMLDVREYSTEKGAQIIQHDKNPQGASQNQLFKIVPVDEWPSTQSSMEHYSFIADETSDRLKDLVAGIAGNVPEVGSALKGLVSFLWPSGQLTIFAQMRSYVEALMRELIAQERVIDLDKRLTGIYNNLDAYQSSVGTQKGQWFTAVLANLNEAEPYFLDKRNPEKTMPYFVALGTVMLTLLREQVLFYEKIYGEPDQMRAEHLSLLQDKLTNYLTASQISRSRAMYWRMSKISLAHSTRTTVGIVGPVVIHIYTASDALTGWTARYEYNPLLSGTSDAEERASREMLDHKQLIQDQFGIELDAFLSTSYLWKYLNPVETAQPTRKKVLFETGPYAGHRYNAFADVPRGTITRIKVHGGNRLDGVELFYDGVSGGLHGWVGGVTHADATMEAGEVIVAAYGTHGDVMHSLWFETNRGRVIGAGSNFGKPWSADPPEGINPTLSHISGFAGTGHIDGLTMHWAYWREE
jgi:hypothetical protein